MTTQELKQMRKVFPKGWKYQDIPAYIRARDKRDVQDYIKETTGETVEDMGLQEEAEYFGPGEFDEDISKEYREEEN